MGAESGGTGGPPAVEKSAGYVPQETMIFQYPFLDTYENFAFSDIFKIR